jgi:hypothetical protein
LPQTPHMKIRPATEIRGLRALPEEADRCSGVKHLPQICADARSSAEPQQKRNIYHGGTETIQKQQSTVKAKTSIYRTSLIRVNQCHQCYLWRGFRSPDHPITRDHPISWSAFIRGKFSGSVLDLFFERREIADVAAQFLRFQQTADDLAAARFRQLIGKRDFRRHGD